MSYKVIRARQLRVGDTLAHESVIGFVVVDIAEQSGQIVALIRTGIREETITLRPNQKVDIFG